MNKTVLLTLLLFGSCFGSNENVPYRALMSVCYTEDLTTISLDDGSVWKTKDYPSCAEANIWKKNDPILIYPSKTCFVKEKYSLYNERLRSFSHVDLSLPSDSTLPTFLSISSIEDNSNMVILKNSSEEQFQFEVSPKAEFNWENGEAVILGWNGNMGPGNDLKFPFIIINTSEKNFIKTNYLKKL